MFTGSGAGLFDIPRSALTEEALQISEIVSGSITASVTPEGGFVVTSVESGSTFIGEVSMDNVLTISDTLVVDASTITAGVNKFFSGSGAGLFEIPRSALTEDALLSTEIATGSITASVTPQGGFIVTSIVSGSTFSGSVFLSSGSFFSGSGEKLFNIPKSAISDLDTSLIFSGSVSASARPSTGFTVTSIESGSTFLGEVRVESGSSFSGSGENLFDIPKSAISDLDSSLIFSGSVTASVEPTDGFIVTSIVSGSTFFGDIKLQTGSFSGSGAKLFDIPRTALTPDALVSTLIASGSATASISPNFGFVVNTSSSIEGDLTVDNDLYVGGAINATELNVTFINSEVIYSSGSNQFGDSVTDRQEFTGSINVSGSLNVDDGIISGDGSGLFNIPQSALSEDAILIY